MIISSSDGKRIVDIGNSENLWAVYSTIVNTFWGIRKYKVSKAIKFLEEGHCSGSEGYETAREFNLIRDKFAEIKPEDATYDIKDKSKVAPWINNISPVVTSCANLFTTADGEDLLFEIVSILCYAQILEVDVTIE